jgi:hypothetical protein
MIVVLTPEEIASIEAAHVISKDPLILRSLPAKEKRKVHLFQLVANQFEWHRRYHETEVNRILMPIIPDYVMMRRFLIDYGFLRRTPSGSEYWRESNQSEPNRP